MGEYPIPADDRIAGSPTRFQCEVYDERMDAHSCEECQAIYRELMHAAHKARQSLFDQPTPPQQVVAWLEQLNEDDCARLRETSSLWKTWRRLQEHRTLTGHSISLLPVPPNAISNPN